jgi:hypothetical protein
MRSGWSEADSRILSRAVTTAGRFALEPLAVPPEGSYLVERCLDAQVLDGSGASVAKVVRSRSGTR